jgi:NtrC-family two-component system sensor histidine kinase KinB
VILQDVTRLRRFNELKDDLVATVAHEFRTPLTSLRMAVHLCLEGVVGAINDKQTELLHAAREDCERLQSFVDDLLDLARLQAGKVAMRKVSLPLGSSGRSHRRAAHVAQQHKVTLRSELSPQLPEAIAVDPERLGLVFGNLIGNAIRHTPECGTVTLRVRTTAMQELPCASRSKTPAQAFPRSIST